MNLIKYFFTGLIVIAASVVMTIAFSFLAFAVGISYSVLPVLTVGLLILVCIVLGYCLRRME